jgi:hypothetical protein
VQSAGYPWNIPLVYPLVRPGGHPILSRWYCRISWIHTQYSLGVFIGYADGPFNIVWMALSDQLDTDRVFIECIHWLG